MRYWISRTEGNVEGPFDEAELRNMLAEGSITLKTQVCAENTENWQTLSSVSGFAAGGGSAVPSEMGFPLLGSYSFNAAFNLGWQLFTKRYGIVLGVSLFAVLASIIPSLCMTPFNIAAGQQGNQSGGGVAAVQLFGTCFGQAWNLLVATPVSIGAIWVIVRIARGHGDATFMDIWAPFKRYGWFLLTELLLIACGIGILIIGAIVGGIPGVLIGFLISALSGDPTTGIVVGAICGTIILLVVVYYLFIRISLTYLLVIDPGAGSLNPADALMRSWNTTKNFAWSLFGLAFVMILIVMASVIACILPVFFFGDPLLNAVLAAAYALLIPVSGMHCRSCGYVRAPDSKGNCPECGVPWEEPATA